MYWFLLTEVDDCIVRMIGRVTMDITYNSSNRLSCCVVHWNTTVLQCFSMCVTAAMYCCVELIAVQSVQVHIRKTNV